MGCGMSTEEDQRPGANNASSSTNNGRSKELTQHANSGVSGRVQWIKARNDQIEASLSMARSKTPNAIKLLLLGAGESGKSTVLKQMRLIHGSGFTEAELVQYSKVIWSDAVQSMRILIQSAHALGIELDSDMPASLLYEYNKMVMNTDPLRMYEEDLVSLDGRRAGSASINSHSLPPTPHRPTNFLDDYVLKYDRRKYKRAAGKWDGMDSPTDSVNIMPTLDDVVTPQSQSHPQQQLQPRKGSVGSLPASPASPSSKFSRTTYHKDVAGVGGSGADEEGLLMMDHAPRSAQLLASKTEVAVAISELWKHDRGIQKCFERSNEFQLEVNAGHYFERILQYSKPGYRVTEQDILMGRIKTTGISETVFNIKNWAFRVFDVGGQRSERRKWIHCFDDVTAVVFVAAVSEYDEVLFEDEWTNRMHEALVLFESICNSRWFSTTPIILFLNKIDVLERKLKTSPVKRYFPEYRGDERNVDEVCKYFQELFHAQNRNRQRPVYVHYTCATDTRTMKFVIAAVTDVIIQRSLHESGII